MKIEDFKARRESALRLMTSLFTAPRAVTALFSMTSGLDLQQTAMSAVFEQV